MKKLLTTIIIILLTLNLNAQIQDDKINHFSVGYLIGAVSNIQTYELLSMTNINPKTSKVISFGVGVGMGLLAGHLKEKYDSNHEGVYNKQDLKATTVGSLSGSLTVRLILWNSVPRKSLPKDVYIK